MTVAEGHRVSEEVRHRLLHEVRREEGEAVAMDDWCPHRGFRLSRSELVGDTIQCGYHGMCFDAQGECVRVPGQDTLSTEAGQLIRRGQTIFSQSIVEERYQRRTGN